MHNDIHISTLCSDPTQGWKLLANHHKAGASFYTVVFTAGQGRARQEGRQLGRCHVGSQSAATSFRGGCTAKLGGALNHCPHFPTPSWAQGAPGALTLASPTLSHVACPALPAGRESLPHGHGEWWGRGLAGKLRPRSKPEGHAATLPPSESQKSLKQCTWSNSGNKTAQCLQMRPVFTLDHC